MKMQLPVWLHISGAVSALAALGGMTAAIMAPDGEAASLLPAGIMGVFATSKIATDHLGKRG